MVERSDTTGRPNLLMRPAGALATTTAGVRLTPPYSSGGFALRAQPPAIGLNAFGVRSGSGSSHPKAGAIGIPLKKRKKLSHIDMRTRL